jgi:GH24 family phage-related lysozyme (muramidase)
MGIHLITAELTSKQRAALESLISHIGDFNFKISSLLKAINNNDRAEIEKQWMRWAMVNGKQDPAILELRQSELDSFLNA